VRVSNGRFKRGPTVPPLIDLDDQDRVRLALREARQRISPGAPDAPTALVTIAGVHGLSNAIRYLNGGRERFVEYVQLAVLNNEPIPCRWWAVYADLSPYYRSIVSFDDVCAASGVMPSELVPILVGTAMRLDMDVGNLVASAMHPQVVAAHAASAVRIDGEYATLSQQDRFTFLQARGMAPVPRNTIISIHANASANAKAAAAATAEPTVPSFSSEMASLSAPRVTVQRQLTERQSTETFEFLRAPAAHEPAAINVEPAVFPTAE